SLLINAKHNPARNYLIWNRNSEVDYGNLEINGEIPINVGMRLAEAAGDTNNLNPAIRVASYKTKNVTAPYSFFTFTSSRNKININAVNTAYADLYLVRDSTSTLRQENKDETLVLGQIIAKQEVLGNDGSAGGKGVKYEQRTKAYGGSGAGAQTEFVNATGNVVGLIPSNNGYSIVPPTTTTELSAGMLYNSLGCPVIMGTPCILGNSQLQNSTINFIFGTSGTGPGWSSSIVALGGTAQFNIPLAAPTVTAGNVSNTSQEFGGEKTFKDKTAFKDTVKILNKETLQFFDLDNSNYVQLRATTDILENYTLSFPNSAPQDGQARMWNSAAGRLSCFLPYAGVIENEVDTTKIKEGTVSLADLRLKSIS